MSRVEIGSDDHRVIIEHEQTSANELATIARDLYQATKPTGRPRTTIGPTGGGQFERADGPYYATNQPSDL